METSQIIIIIGGALLGASILAIVIRYLQSQKGNRARQEIVQRAREIASGDFSARLKASRNHALSDLIAVINEMAGRLEQQQRDLLTEKAQMNGVLQELRDLENVRKDFVANVSHELKTPLTSIKGYAEALKNGAMADAEAARRFVDKIEKNADQLQNLIEDLLHLSELDSGHRPMDLVNVSLGAMVSQVQATYLDQLRINNQRLELDISKGLEVLAQPSALKLVLSNLIDNAIKYSPEGGRVRVTAYQRGDLCEIIVADKGMGIPEADLPHIFERFYRVDKARSRELGGTGLGLAIVKHLLKAQKGEIIVTSQPGAGSRFTVTLPAVS